LLKLEKKENCTEWCSRKEKKWDAGAEMRSVEAGRRRREARKNRIERGEAEEVMHIMRNSKCISLSEMQERARINSF
jgi:hypothetical protein